MKLNNLSIRSKVLFIVIVPILALIVVSGMKGVLLNQKANDLVDIVELMKISVAASNLVHELQKERGASAGYTNSKGQKFAKTLKNQRGVTDAKIKTLFDLIDNLVVVGTR